jgi:hypothetical protein
MLILYLLPTKVWAHSHWQPCNWATLEHMKRLYRAEFKELEHRTACAAYCEGAADAVRAERTWRPEEVRELSSRQTDAFGQRSWKAGQTRLSTVI